MSLWSWQDAIKAVFLDRVNILAEYEHQVSSPSFSMRLPSVVCLKSYVQPSRHPAFTRFNVFLRDRFECQYCGSPDDLTFDHVVPRCCRRRRRPGKMSSPPVRPAICARAASCRSRRACSRTRSRIHPTVQDLHNNGRLFPPNYLHDSWMDYLYWDVELQP